VADLSHGVDIWGWVHSRLVTAFPSWSVEAEKRGLAPRAPALIWSLSAAMVDTLAAWSGALTVVLLVEPGRADAALRKVVDEVGSWETPGPLHTAQLTSLAGDMASGRDGAAPNHTIRQYTFTYDLTWTTT
jgi:hypothetical protein